MVSSLKKKETKNNPLTIRKFKKKKQKQKPIMWFTDMYINPSNELEITKSVEDVN